MPARIHLNPKLPVDFFDTPCTDGCKDRLEEWLGKPYAVSNPDGTLTVYCLNGDVLRGPSVLGTVDSFEAACHLAEQKQVLIGYGNAQGEADASRLTAPSSTDTN